MICEEVVRNTTLSLFSNPFMTFKKIKLIMVIAFNGEKNIIFQFINNQNCKLLFFLPKHSLYFTYNILVQRKLKVHKDLLYFTELVAFEMKFLSISN